MKILAVVGSFLQCKNKNQIQFAACVSAVLPSATALRIPNIAALPGFFPGF